MRRTKEEAEQTRQDVLAAALRVFSEKGYAAATLNEVAERAGVTRGAIYWHFENKAQLYNTLLAQASAISSGVVSRATSEGGDLPEILERIFVGLLHAVEEDSTLRAVLELELFKTEQIDELAESRRQRLDAGKELLQNIAVAMQRGGQEGTLRGDLDPMTMARSFIAFQNGVIRLWLMDPRAFSLKEEAAPLASIYLQGLQIGVS